MRGWERWAKRLFKGAIWSAVYIGAALAVGLTPSWPLLAVVIATGLVGNVLDILLPTGDPKSATTSGHSPDSKQ